MFLCDKEQVKYIPEDCEYEWKFGAAIRYGQDPLTFNEYIYVMIKELNPYFKSYLASLLRPTNGCWWDCRRKNVSCFSEIYPIKSNQRKVTGVEFMPKFNKWVSTCIKNNELILIGLYDKFEDACVAFYETDLFKQAEYERLYGEGYNIADPVDGNMTDYHSRYFQEVDGLFFGLPAWYDSEERNKLVSDLTDSRPDLYQYNLPENKRDKHPEMVENRLSMLGSYILEPVLYPRNGLISSEYKKNEILRNETVLFSDSLSK